MVQAEVFITHSKRLTIKSSIMVEFNLEEQLEISKQMAAKYDVIERHNKLFDFHIKHLPTKKP